MNKNKADGFIYWVHTQPRFENVLPQFLFHEAHGLNEFPCFAIPVAVASFDFECGSLHKQILS